VNPEPDQVDFYRIAIWVLIVLAAGFIGQFGKSFAKHLIERFRKKPGPSAPEQAGKTTAPELPREGGPLEIPPPRPGMTREEAKIRKKELKADQKRKKKENK